jgi:hypothetical protein
MQFSTNQWNIKEVITLIPEAYADLLDGINISGNASLSGSARGTYNDSIMPLISANLNYTDGKVQYPALLPFPLNNINLSLAANINLAENSQLSILNSQFSTPNSQFSIPNSQFSILNSQFDKIVYTGAIDEYFDYRLGRLDWRTVSFKTRVEDTQNYQGNAVVNYTSHDEPYTRIIEHKHFEMFDQEVYDIPKTVVSEEYSTEYKSGMEPYYPVNDERNTVLANLYKALADKEKDVIFGGRLAEYKYYDMAPIIEKVLGMSFE